MNRQKLKPYQEKSIEIIRSLGEELNDFSDIELANYYSQWSEENFAAGWIAMGEEMFYRYATNTPFSIWRENKKRTRENRNE